MQGERGAEQGFLAGGGEAGQALRLHDWRHSALGQPEAWPSGLRTAVRLMLHTRHRMCIFWGVDSLFLWNDAFGRSMGAERRASALAQPARLMWAEVWDIVSSQIDHVMAGKGATWHENQLVPIRRDGKLEDVYWTYGYSPIDDDRAASGVGGVLVITTETTASVMAEQRLARELDRQRALLLQMPGFVGVMNGPDHVFSFVNDAYVAIAGKRDFIGHPARAVFPELAGQGVHERLDAVYASGQRFVARAVPIRFAGEAEGRFIDVLYEPIRDEADAVTGVFIGGYDVTDNARTHAALHATEAQLRAANANLERDVAERSRELAVTWAVSPDLLVVVNADGCVERSNPAWQVTLGWTEEELRTMPFSELVHPDDAERTQHVWEGLRQRGEPALRFENRYRRKSGGWVWLSWVAVPDGDKVYCSARDVDANKQQALALAQTLAERDRLWRSARDILFVLDARGVLASANPAATAILGWDNDELIGRSLFDFVVPDDLALTHDALTNAIGNTMPIVENRYRHKDGGFRWISWTAAPEGDRVFASGRHITAEKEAALALARTSADRDRILRNAHDLFVVCDLAGTLVSVSDAARGMLGWAPDELLGRHVTELIHPDDRPPLQQGRLIAERYVGTLASENRFRHKDGSWRTIAWLSSIDEGLVYAHGRDITVEREQAEALRLAEDSLRQSQKMEAVGQLTGGIAHDFNNLLMGISGSLQLLQHRVSQGRVGEVDRYVHAAMASVKRAAALTHRLLAFSRRQTLDPKPANVNRLLGDMEDLIRRTVGPAVELEVVGAGGLWATLVDANQLENAILNLCINARDAMPGGGRITIETANKWLDDRAAKERDVPPGQYLSVCVTDTGTGMTPDVQAKAFDPFFTTKPLGMGTGLGLSMIYGFVRQSGGQVRIYSELGQGTTMCLYLPRHVGDGVDAEQPAGAARGAQPEPQHDTVLVVDDEPTVRMLITEVLEEAGFTVLEADDGRSGLKLLQGDARVDLLITDVGLPGGMNGRQLADAARVQRPALKVLFITGYAENAVVGNGHLDAGMAILTKPFDIESLSAKIRDILGGRSTP